MFPEKDSLGANASYSEYPENIQGTGIAKVSERHEDSHASLSRLLTGTRCFYADTAFAFF
jgi:hypothetical protein